MRRIAAALCLAAIAPLHAQTSGPRPADEMPQRIDKERANSSGAKSDWERKQEERDFKEADLPLPAMPDKQALIEFFVTSASSFHFFIDPASLSVGPDGVVRYTLVARSASGYENISYEGIRCESGTVKIFAFANDGQWKRSNSEWQEILPKSTQRWHNVLRGRFFCPNRLTIVDAAEGLDALRRGQHPAVRNTGI